MFLLCRRFRAVVCCARWRSSTNLHCLRKGAGPHRVAEHAGGSVRAALRGARSGSEPARSGHRAAGTLREDGDDRQPRGRCGSGNRSRASHESADREDVEHYAGAAWPVAGVARAPKSVALTMTSGGQRQMEVSATWDGSRGTKIDEGLFSTRFCFTFLELFCKISFTFFPNFRNGLHGRAGENFKKPHKRTTIFTQGKPLKIK